ncbi:hypothetical protein [Rhizobium sp. Rhizsp42]|jgi:hypothetical protein|uniref:hypothetical protein n=1 Tax=Rhizobium sp. Rhizsp42 TaxID=3243034 RepID=UPI0039B00D92
MSLATEILDSCLVLSRLDQRSRHGLIERILQQLQAYHSTALHGVPPDKHFWIDTLIAWVSGSTVEIASMQTPELLEILVEFAELIAVLDGISASRIAPPRFH